MSDIVRKILEGRQGEENSERSVAQQAAVTEDYKFFSIILGEGIAEEFVEFRMRNGNRTCFGYDSLLWFNFNPAENCIDFQFGSILVTVTGKGLDGKIWSGVKHKRLAWIREASTEAEEHDEDNVFVESILVTPAEE